MRRARRRSRPRRRPGCRGQRGWTRRWRRGSRRRSGPRPHRPGPRPGARAARAAGCGPPRRCGTAPHSAVRRTSRTVTARWWRTWARSAKWPARNRPSGPSVHCCGEPVAAAAGRSMPIRTSSRWASATCSGVSPEQRQRGAPRDQPAQVGGELSVEAEVERARHVPGRERGPGAQVDQPLPRLDAGARSSAASAGSGGGQVRARRAGGVGRPHVGVVGRVGVQPGEQLLHVRLLVHGSAPGWLLLLPDGRGRGLGLGGRAEAAEPVGGEHLRRVGQLGGQPVRRGVLVRAPGRGCGRARAGPAGRWSRTAATRRRRPRPCSPSALERVGQVGERVPRGRQHA